MKYTIVAAAIILISASCNNNKPVVQDEAPVRAETKLPEGQELMTKSDCYTCHTADTKIVGPALKDIAAKYPNTPENVKMLAEKVVKGGAGVWGTTPMAPHSTLSAADAEKMTAYILTVK